MGLLLLPVLDLHTRDSAGLAVRVLERPGPEVTVALGLEVSGLALSPRRQASLAADWQAALSAAVEPDAGRAWVACPRECQLWVWTAPDRWTSALAKVEAVIPGRIRDRARATLVVAGPVDGEAALEAASELRFHGENPRAPQVEPPEALPPRPGDTRLTVRWAVPAPGDPARDAWDRLAGILAEGPASRLYRRLRERDGLTYTIDTAADESTYTVSFLVPPDRVTEAKAAVDEEIATLAASGPTPGERDAADRLAGAALRVRRAGDGAVADLVRERMLGLEAGTLLQGREVDPTDALPRLPAKVWVSDPAPP